MRARASVTATVTASIGNSKGSCNGTVTTTTMDGVSEDDSGGNVRRALQSECTQLFEAPSSLGALYTPPKTF